MLHNLRKTKSVFALRWEQSTHSLEVFNTDFITAFSIMKLFVSTSVILWWRNPHCLNVHSLLCLYWRMDLHPPTHTQCRTQPWQSCSHSVCLIFSLAPLPSWEHSWHPEAQRGSNSGLKAVSHFRAGTLSRYQLSIPLFLLFGPTTPRLNLRSWAKDPSMENDLFERWSGSFQSRFSSHSVSQRCVYIWSSARAPIQECELAEDIIKAMPVLICGLTFKSLCSLRAVFFLATVAAEYQL